MLGKGTKSFNWKLSTISIGKKEGSIGFKQKKLWKSYYVKATFH